VRTAIKGATPSGLACAAALERSGMEYELFDRQHEVGSPFHYGSVWLTDSRTGLDPLQWINSAVGYSLIPAAPVHHLLVRTPQKERRYAGELGWIMASSQMAGSLERQMANRLHHPFQMAAAPDSDFLAEHFDQVVHCGRAGVASAKNGIWQMERLVRVRGMTALGDFDPNTVYIHSNFDYCPNGVLYMIPLSTATISLALCVPGATSNQMDAYWNDMLVEEHIRWKGLEAFQYTHSVGYPSGFQQGKFSFAEMGSGFADLFLGVGQAAAIAEGYKTGLALAGKLDDNMRQLLTYEEGKPRCADPLTIIGDFLQDERRG
jgi:hypothetical protein